MSVQGQWRRDKVQKCSREGGKLTVVVLDAAVHKLVLLLVVADVPLAKWSDHRGESSVNEKVM